MTYFPIRLKLAFLAGVPVAGAVLLSIWIVLGAREQASKAEALGSIESLAELSATMGRVIDELQTERALLARDLGLRTPTEVPFEGKAKSRPKPDRERLSTQFESTDRALATLGLFLRSRDLAQLPGRLAANLQRAQAQLAGLSQVRRASAATDDVLLSALSFYRLATRNLTAATAALAELSDDGELLREITSLVSIMELKERASEQHAVLSYAFGAAQFPPGSYRLLVTLVSEEETHSNTYRTLATDENAALLLNATQSATVDQAEALRKQVLESTEDDFDVGVDEWFDAQQNSCARQCQR